MEANRYNSTLYRKVMTFKLFDDRLVKNLHFGYEGHWHLKKYYIILTYRVYEKE